MAADGVDEQLARLALAVDDVVRRERMRVDERVDVADHLRLADYQAVVRETIERPSSATQLGTGQLPAQPVAHAPDVVDELDLAPASRSLRRSREACESSVRVRRRDG